ncbi:MAG: hypothetical protein QXI60_00725 [Thermofilaceae archaeon]
MTEILGDGAVEAVRLKNLKTGGESLMPPGRVFIIYIGHTPNTFPLPG